MEKSIGDRESLFRKQLHVEAESSRILGEGTSSRRFKKIKDTQLARREHSARCKLIAFCGWPGKEPGKLVATSFSAISCVLIHRERLCEIPCS